jgi:hypothetical protein
MLLLSSHSVFNHIIAQHSTSPHTLLSLVTSCCLNGVDQICYLCLFRFSSFLLPSFLIPFLPSIFLNSLLITYLILTPLLIIFLYFTLLHFSLQLSYFLSHILSATMTPIPSPMGMGSGPGLTPFDGQVPPTHNPYLINTHTFVCMSVCITAAEYSGLFLTTSV